MPQRWVAPFVLVAIAAAAWLASGYEGVCIPADSKPASCEHSAALSHTLSNMAQIAFIAAAIAVVVALTRRRQTR